MFYRIIFVVLSLVNVAHVEPNVVKKSNVNWNNPTIWKPPIFTPECGKSTLNMRIKPLIYDGNKTKPGEFPWHAGVYENKRAINQQPICGATIISSRYLLSAAHCFATETKGTAIIRPASDYYILVGKLESRNNNSMENNEQRYEYSMDSVVRTKIAELITELYRGGTYKHQNDIIIIVTKSEIIFNPNVSAICLINENRPYIGNYSDLWIAGWGLDESGKQSEDLRSIKLPFVSPDECSSFSNHDDLPTLLTTDKFCTGRKGGKSLGSGDSGDGVITNGPNDSFYLIGVVSISLYEGPVVLYTSVPHFHDWISETIYYYSKNQQRENTWNHLNGQDKLGLSTLQIPLQKRHDFPNSRISHLHNASILSPANLPREELNTFRKIFQFCERDEIVDLKIKGGCIIPNITYLNTGNDYVDCDSLYIKGQCILQRGADAVAFPGTRLCRYHRMVISCKMCNASTWTTSPTKHDVTLQSECSDVNTVWSFNVSETTAIQDLRIRPEFTLDNLEFKDLFHLIELFHFTEPSDSTLEISVKPHGVCEIPDNFSTRVDIDETARCHITIKDRCVMVFNNTMIALPGTELRYKCQNAISESVHCSQGRWSPSNINCDGMNVPIPNLKPKMKLKPCKEKPDLEFQSTCVRKKECWYYGYKGAVKLKEYNDIEYCNRIDLLVCCPAQEYKNMFSSSIKIVEEKCEEYSKYRFHITTADRINSPSLMCQTYEPAIARGSIADPLEFPHMLRVGVMEGPNLRWICGATLISEKFALGAAHCATHGNYQKSELVIGLGARDAPEMKNRQTLFKVIKQHFPSNKNQIEGNPQNYANDIMLFELNDTITFDRYVRPICLYTSPSLPPAGTKATIAGWGDIHTGLPDDISTSLTTMMKQPAAGYFLKGTVSLDSNRRCEEILMNNTSLYNSSSMLCSKVDQARLKNESVPCEGDNGGPIQIPMKNRQCMFRQLGIISHGDIACGNFTYPAVYTKISFYIGWIQSIVWPENKIKGKQ